MKPILSILIPTINTRAALLDRLLEQVKQQVKVTQVCNVEIIPLKNSVCSFYRLLCENDSVEILILKDNCQNKIGEKRNKLVELAEGEYSAFIDDDDRIAENYFVLLLGLLKENSDCCNLNGIYTENGENPKLFTHSIEYNGWYENLGVFYRYPNHLNAIKTSIVKQMPFLEINNGEDKDFSVRLMESGLIKTESRTSWVLYYYDYISNK
jgi:glycosyltransferase involved in cell wall biosynthesis